MQNIKNFVRKYIKNEDGLVTIEWVGIAAVVVIAAIVIATFMMDSTAGVGNTVADTQDTVAGGLTGITTLPSETTFGRD